MTERERYTLRIVQTMREMESNTITKKSLFIRCGIDYNTVHNPSSNHMNSALSRMIRKGSVLRVINGLYALNEKGVV